MPFAQLTDPVDNGVAVTPSDETDLDNPTRGLYVGGGGDVSVEMVGTGTALVFTAVPTGAILPIRVTRVNDTDTDATDMVALY